MALGTIIAGGGGWTSAPTDGGRQLGVSIITFGVFLRKHLIAKVRDDALTKSVIGLGWHNFVQPKKSVVLDARQ